MILLPVLVIGFSFFVQSCLGFGGGLIAIPLLGFFFPIAKAVALVTVFQLFMGLLILKTYGNIAWEPLKRFLPGMIIGILAGAVSVKYVNDDLVRIFLALFILAYLARSRFRILQRAITMQNTSVLSFCGGWIMGLMGTGGPLYVVYFKEHTPDLTTFRASLVMAFFIGHLLRIPGYVSVGIMDAETLKTALFALPIFLLALWSGQILHSRISVRAFHGFVDILLVATSISLIVKAFL